MQLFLRYDLPQFGSRRRLISPMYDEYGEVIMEDDGYYYSPHGPEVLPFLSVIILTIALLGFVFRILLKQQYQPSVTFQHCGFIITKGCNIKYDCLRAEAEAGAVAACGVEVHLRRSRLAMCRQRRKSNKLSQQRRVSPLRLPRN